MHKYSLNFKLVLLWVDKGGLVFIVKMNPLIVHNYRRTTLTIAHLIETLDSILAQTYINWGVL
jgi:hypothetical protein